jgi:uncharacterized protein
MLSLPGVPFDLEWSPEPEGVELAADGVLSATAPASTDLFVSPAGDQSKLGAPRLLGRPPDGDFVVVARVHAPFAAAFDAGALILWAGERSWAKLAVEWSPTAQPWIVSVVTRGLSDDCNSQALASGEAWLRIGRLGSYFAFHASTDGSRWDFVRQFALDTEDVELGLLVQSPTGDGCTATFRDVRFEQRTLGNLRDGS